MSINATLLGQMITFILFVIFTMKWVWPFIISALDEREKKIAHGLASAEQGVRDLELAQRKAKDIIRDAKLQAAEIVEQANKRGAQVIEAAKQKAREEGLRLIELAKVDIEQEMQSAKQHLRQQVSAVVISGAEKILERSVDQAANQDLLEKLMTEI